MKHKLLTFILATTLLLSQNAHALRPMARIERLDIIPEFQTTSAYDPELESKLNKLVPYSHSFLVVREFLRAFGSLDNMRGLNICELGVESKMDTVLSFLRAYDIDAHGVGDRASSDVPYVHRSPYDRYLSKEVLDDSVDVMYSSISLYPPEHRGQGDILNTDLKDKYGYKNAFPYIARKLKPGGLLITTVMDGEFEYILTDEEVELLGFERAVPLYRITSPADFEYAVSVLRKKPQNAGEGPKSARFLIQKNSALGQI